MKNFREGEPKIGGYGFYGACADGECWGSSHQYTFSLGVFEIVPNKKGEPKRGRTVCRVKSAPGDLKEAEVTAELVCQVLEAGLTLPKKTCRAGPVSDNMLRALLRNARKT